MDEGTRVYLKRNNKGRETDVIILKDKIFLAKLSEESSFRYDIPVVFYKLNTKYVTISQNTTKIIVLCFTIYFTTTCFGPFL